MGVVDTERYMKDRLKDKTCTLFIRNVLLLDVKGVKSYGTKDTRIAQRIISSGY